MMIQLVAMPVTAENFQSYGQVIRAQEDGKLYDRHDAQLVLNHGTPRFYIMRLHQRGRVFHHITRHQRCTQCLGSLNGKVWLLAVAPPCDAPQPELEAIQAFQIPGDCFVKLEVGTWHAGPYFDHAWVDFYNLELADTNVVDHETCDLRSTFGYSVEILDHGMEVLQT
jgi:ureidoglycolate hydrolase